MKRLFVIDDPEHVGRELVDMARARRIDARLCLKSSEIPRDDVYVFAWMANEPHDAGWMRVLMRYVKTSKKPILIPDVDQVVYHDDRLAQTLRLGSLMPKTLVLTSASRAELALEELPLPFVSKSMCGHGGANSRAIATRDNARLEISLVFGKDAVGIPAKPRQRDYLLWQEFLPGNPFTYRVVRVGNYEMMLRRYREEHDPFKVMAHEPVNDFDDDDAFSAMQMARTMFNVFGTKFCAIDIALNQREKMWKLLNTSARWDRSSFEEAKFFGKSTGYSGLSWMQLMLDELEEGVFG